MSKTIFEKIWDSHVVDEVDGWTILYIDRHLGHDGSARGFRILKEKGLPVRRPDKTLISMDHVVPTLNQSEPPTDPAFRRMLDVVRENVAKFNIAHF
ncbi:MAG: 3-isopropylmalate dehydratase large subunit, partial [SAR324 cluster bacterium]|nr:3-isopropylmalate dehydratase large subunit [SAR324 cluster bacterium]